MMTAQIEDFEDCIDEMKAIFPGHWEELGIFKEHMPLDPQYEVYRRRNKDGELVMPTVREDGKIIAYWPTFVAPGLHYGSTLTATMDILYVHPEHRNSGAAKMLFKCLKQELTRRGVKVWYVGSKLHKDIESFYLALGFEPVEKYFGIWLGVD